MPLGGLLTAGIVGGSLAYGVGSKLSKESKAKRMEKALGAKPVYNIQEPTLKNQYLAENNAQQGLSDESRMMYEQQANRGLSESIDALLKAGGGVNSISDLYANYQDKGMELANLDDQIRFRNQQLLMSQNEKMANELDKSYQINKLDPWKDEKQRIAELRTMGQNDLNAGISMAANGLIGAAGMKPQTPTIEDKTANVVQNSSQPPSYLMRPPYQDQKTNTDYSMYARPNEQGNPYINLLTGQKYPYVPMTYFGD